MTIDQRLQKLESSNRVMKAALTVCILVVVSVVTIGATSVAPRVLDVQKIILRDEAGNERGQLFATDKAWGLVLFNKGGTRGASLFVAQDANGLFLSDGNGNLRQAFTSDLNGTKWSVLRPGSDKAQFELTDSAQGTGLVVRDRANAERVEFGASASDQGSTLMLSDRNGRVRTILSETGDGIMTYGEDGSVKWSPAWDKLSPREKEHLKGLLPKSLTSNP
jgi:hypothetical protein